MTDARTKRIALLKRWAEALRSGKYVQAHEVLRVEMTNRMCCLGVLCDVANPEKWGANGSYDEVREIPPDNVMRLAGLTGDRNTTAFMESPKDANQFARLNDIEKASYEEIADVVDWMRYDEESRA